ncbi:CPBP family intramembrane glutamic endopeptidase [Undibacterium pigrum]|nr:CPBP family intramembrane glutamic endopeptidase [Undibacterium pigrum]
MLGLIAVLSELDEKATNSLLVVAVSMTFVTYYIFCEKDLHVKTGAYPVFRYAEGDSRWPELVYPVLMFAVIVLVLYWNNVISFQQTYAIHYQSLLLTLGAAAAEEIFFRGYVLAGLKKYMRLEWAILISSALFSLAHHSGNIVNLQYAHHFMFAVAMAAVTVKYRSLLCAIVFHFISNYSIGVRMDYFSEAYNGQGFFQFHDRAASIFYLQVCIAVFLVLSCWIAKNYYATLKLKP